MKLLLRSSRFYLSVVMRIARLFLSLLVFMCPSLARAATHVQQASNSDVSGKSYTSFTATFGSANIAGNAILVGVTFGNTNPTITATDTQGNVYTQAVKTYDSGHSQGCAILYATNIKGGSSNVVTVKFSGSVAYLALGIHEYSGIASASALDVTVGSQGTGTAVSSGSATTTTSGDLIFGCGVEDSTGSGDTFTAGAGFTKRVDLGTAAAYADEDETQTAPGAVAVTWTLAASRSWIADLAAFKSSSGGPATPGITSLSPTSGPVGTSITITGTNFGATQGTSTLAFNGTAATPTSWSNASIVAAVPTGATTGNVVVTVGGLASNGIAFTVTVAPSITSVSPTSGPVGASVTIAGANFGATQGTSTVKFNGTVATPTSWSNTSIVAAVPTGTTTGNVVVTVGGLASNGVAFSVTVAPSITNLSPTSGSIGTSVTITGTNFGTTQGTSTVTFNGVSATPTSWSNTSVVAAVPAVATTGNVVVAVGGLASNGVAFTVTVAPSITSLSPTSGLVGTSVTIGGANFGTTQGTSAVTFNGTPATPTSWNNTSVVATVPSGATTGNVVVTIGGLASNGVSFTVTSAPNITSLSPVSGGVGTSVTISGTSFGTTQGASTVTFNGTTATPTSWSNTSVVAAVPPGATTGNVVVTVGGLASNGVTFTVTTAPGITSLSPTSGPVGTSVTISGTTFGVTQETNTLTFNGTVAAPTSWSNTSIVAAVPAGATTGNLVVTVGGLASNGVTFAVTVAPSITSLLPTSGVAGSSVTINGTNFGATQGTSTVTFNGITATPTSWSNTSVVAAVPTGATTGSVVVTVGGLASNGMTFTVTVAPSITSLSPTSGTVGSSVTVTGANFGTTQGTSTITFNGMAATPTSWNNTAVVAAVPTGAATGSVVVTVGGLASNGVTFTVTVPPSITSLLPTSGTVGSSVTIAGTNFGASQGTSTVTFNGTTATPTSWNNTSLVATVPAGATTGNVVVTVGGLASNGLPFTVTVAPSIAGLSPTSGPTGVSVIITGANFGATQGTSTITFNGTSATPTSWSSTSLAAPVPTGATTGNVVVTVGGLASNGAPFTVVTPPNIASLSPASGNVGSSVTITGTNFGATQSASTVAFNGVTATPTSWSNTSVVATVPSAATTGNVVLTVSGIASNGVTFSVTTTPTISSLSPTSGTVGTSVSITGTNFGATQGSSTVTFNGTATTPTNWSSTMIVAPVPAGATSGSVVVSVGGTASNGVSFAVTAPGITSLLPTSGPVGTSLTITGTNFGATQGTSTISFNGVAGTPTGWAATKIVVPVPLGAATGSVVVTVGGLASNGVSFSVTAPSITSLSPTSGPIGTSVTITGANFGATQGTSKATFNGVASAPASWTATKIVVPVPSGATTGNVLVTVGALASNGVSFTVTAPSITSLSPTSGPVGTSVTINGTSFGTTQGSSTITFNGVAATPTSWTATKIVGPVPQGATTGNVVVTVGGLASAGVSFTVTAPSITSLSPTSGPVGTSVTINGASFGASQGTSTITFNGVAATPTSWAATKIVAPVPLGASTGNVVVTVGGLASAGVNFTVSAPSITSLSPTSGPIGTSVTITGTNFGATQGTSAITFNGVLTTPTSWAATKIVAPVPAAATTGSVVVAVGGLASAGVSFTVTAPNITSLSPTSGPIGTSVTINGTSFGTTQGSAAVTFNGVAAAPASWSSTKIVAPVPVGTTTGNVVVTLGQASNGVIFTVALSNITSVSPSSGLIGASVTITGTNFGLSQGTSTVSFGGVVATPTSWSATSIVTTVPAGASTGNVVVTVGGLPSNGITFGVIPSIGSLSSMSGPVGSTVTISGASFGPTQGSSTVTFNGIPAIPASWNASAIVAPVPAGATSGTVVVTVGGLSSGGAGFTVTPNITGLSPNAGPVGTSVTISGTSFGATQKTSSVTFSGIPAMPTTWSDTSIVVPVPAGAASGNVTVTVVNPSLSLNSVMLFILNAQSGIAQPISNAAQCFGGSGQTITCPGGSVGNLLIASYIGQPGDNLTAVHDNAGNTYVDSGQHGTSNEGGECFIFYAANAKPGATSWTFTSTRNGNFDDANIYDVSNASISPFDNATSTNNNDQTVFGPLAGPSITAGTANGFVVMNLGITSNSILTVSSPFVFDPQDENNGWAHFINPMPGTFQPSWPTNQAEQAGGVNTWGGIAAAFEAALVSQSSNAAGFVVTTPPIINGLSPTSGPVGTSVVVSGAGFGSAQGASTISFNGTVATPVSWSDSNIVVNVPSGATTGNVVVAAAGLLSNGIGFTVTVPSIASLSPTSGPVGAYITISGTSFGTSQGNSTVTFNGIATTPTSWSATTIVAQVPAGATTGNVVVTVGGLSSNGEVFVVAANITSLSLSSGPVGATVTITGTSFGAMQGTSTVTFNGIAATPASWSATTIVTNVPAGAATGNIVVTVGGIVSNAIAFAVTPAITSLSPVSGQIGTIVAISGTSFGATQGASTIAFNGTAAAPTSWTDSNIVVAVPAGAISGNVVVTTGGQASNAIGFTVTAPPIAVTISPKRGGLTTTQTLVVTATLSNDVQNQGVIWTVAGTACGPNGCGGFTNISPSSATYTPPATPGQYTITATSVADNTKNDSATIAVTDLGGIYSWRGVEGDTTRQGVNAKEYALNTTNVNGASFGKVFSCPLDGAVYAQPLYVANLAIPGAGVHNVIFSATENDSLYAFDADNPSCQSVWPAASISLLPANEDHVTSGDVGSGNLGPVVGITGTPVIDPSSNTIYLVAASKNTATNTFIQRLHAIDITTGQERPNSPVLISAQTPGTGSGNFNGYVFFDPLMNNQRPGLLLLNGVVYIAWASHANNPVYHGWVIGYNATSLQQVAAFSPSPDGSLNAGEEGGIWMSGASPAADANGNIYLSVGTGTFDDTTNTVPSVAPNDDFGDSALKLSTAGNALVVADFYTPPDQPILNSTNSGFGSVGAVLFSSGNSSFLLTAGKDGNIYLLNQNQLGGFLAGPGGTDAALQNFNVIAPQGFRGSPAFFNGTAYIAGQNSPLFAIPFNMALAVLAAPPYSGGQQSNEIYGAYGATPSASAQGTANGIVWVVDAGPSAGAPTIAAILRAYDATNLQNLLYASPSSGAQAAGLAVKFAVPIVANGKVYIGTQAELDVYGLLPN